MSNLSAEDVGRLRERLSYNPDTGVFSWLIPPRGRVLTDSTAGYTSLRHKYIYIRVNGERFAAHRLAWLFMTGSWPSEWVDHIDGDRTNNAWANLRQADKSANHQNRGISRNNTSGHTGVSWKAERGKWYVRVKAKNKAHFFGYFDTKDEAIAAHAEAKRAIHQFHGEVVARKGFADARLVPDGGEV